MTCKGDRGKCKHARYFSSQEETVSRPKSLSKKGLEDLVDSAIDITSYGPWFKKKCISRSLLPEEPGDDVSIAEMCQGGWETSGRIPEKCYFIGKLRHQISIICHYFFFFH